MNRTERRKRCRQNRAVKRWLGNPDLRCFDSLTVSLSGVGHLRLKNFPMVNVGKVHRFPMVLRDNPRIQVKETAFGTKYFF